MEIAERVHVREHDAELQNLLRFAGADNVRVDRERELQSSERPPGESNVITKIGGTGPFHCQVNGTRIALGHGAAAQIVSTAPRVIRLFVE